MRKKRSSLLAGELLFLHMARQKYEDEARSALVRISLSGARAKRSHAGFLGLKARQKYEDEVRSTRVRILLARREQSGAGRDFLDTFLTSIMRKAPCLQEGFFFLYSYITWFNIFRCIFFAFSI